MTNSENLTAPAMLPDTHIPAGSVVPLGERIPLPGRGVTFVRHAPGPPGAPTILLLHGWLATGALNWYRCFEPLSEHFNVLAIDHRGHGRGIRSNRRFRLADCADDAAALIDQMSAGPVVAVGYSMGGPIAQLLWREHPDLVNGMVLIATGAEFVPGNRHRYAASALLVAAVGTRVGSAATIVPRGIVKALLGTPDTRDRPSDLTEWGRQEMAKHSGRVMLEAGHAVANYSAKRWIGNIDVPTSVIVTEEDSAVSPEAQLRMAMAIPGAHINRIPLGHVSCIDPTFGRKVTDACLDVQNRIDLGYDPHPPDYHDEP
ncbi:MAG: alpha/beta hydrolase [Acidimicrobiales bacterium]|nr:alpha/beta hydrolase [Acidimicrobiales bacterium]